VNPSATLAPSALSAANAALSHTAPGVWACVSWLPLGSTGRTPVTLKANGAWAAEGTALAGGDPAAGGAAEHPASTATHPDSTATHPDSTATTRGDAAGMIDSFAGLRWWRRTA
jgi:hypothetical protein